MLRHILAIDTDGRSGRADGIQHDVHDLPEAVFIELRILTENAVVKILFICHGSITVKAKVLDSLANSGFENCILPLQFMGQT